MQSEWRLCTRPERRNAEPKGGPPQQIRRDQPCRRDQEAGGREQRGAGDAETFRRRLDGHGAGTAA
eukprot:6207232-Pleurochrysis_carterae.AAC.7